MKQLVVKKGILGVLCVGLLGVGVNSFLVMSSPYGIKELRGYDFLAAQPMAENCEDCSNIEYYRNTDDTLNCDLIELDITQGVENATKRVVSFDTWLEEKGKTPYVFHTGEAYGLFDKNCWSVIEEETTF